MITITILDTKKSKKTIETFTSLDKVRNRGSEIINGKKSLKIVAVSYDTPEEEKICIGLLDRQKQKDGDK